MWLLEAESVLSVVWVLGLVASLILAVLNAVLGHSLGHFGFGLAWAGTKIAKAKITSGGGATLRFSGVGDADSFGCALSGPSRHTVFRPCTSPHTYRHLRPPIRLQGPGKRTRQNRRDPGQEALPDPRLVSAGTRGKTRGRPYDRSKLCPTES
jgi:hypothetical protein